MYNQSLSYNISFALVNATSDSFVFTTINSFDNVPAKDHEKILSYILFAVLMSLAFFGLIKSFLLLISYIISNIFLNLFDLIYVTISSKFKINICLKIRKTFMLTFWEIQKLYTFNFYSFQNGLIGLCLIILYLLFLAYNLTFTLSGILNDFGRSTLSNIILSICFCINVFFELYLSFFYYTRKTSKLKTYLLFSAGLVYGTYIVMAFAIYVDNQYKSITYSNLFALVFYIYLLFINFLAVKKIFFYNPVKKAFKTYVAQQQLINNNESVQVVKYIDAELEVLTKIYTMNDVYVTLPKEKNISFCYRDKYHFKKPLLALFVVNQVLKICICIVLFLPLYKLYNYIPGQQAERENFLYKVSIVQKSLLVGNNIVLNILAWMTFMKTAIKNYYLY